MNVFKALYQDLGYEACANSEYDDGWQKIAIFIDSIGTPTHTARQLPNGFWTSKCGDAEDIEHELSALEGNLYGQAVCFMRRKIVE